MESREAVGACFRKTEVEALGWTLHLLGNGHGADLPRLRCSTS
jgi:hypothetical protein